MSHYEIAGDGNVRNCSGFIESMFDLIDDMIYGFADGTVEGSVRICSVYDIHLQWLGEMQINDSDRRTRFDVDL